ncbi:GntR family transcriptional regulator [Corynebacterium alimapuense]|uniref:GntR family transcriptional regulator n=1 Tax=Corynebacterium alimapuense TaxID=1576874 RepID=A0A3M8K6U2_9CORY|nr:GntR family transcriptional regulator [Corynebacterium alimapuense]RNE48931.1 GntR family transcriptional regulator [Corynebacterium alimapuense]
MASEVQTKGLAREAVRGDGLVNVAHSQIRKLIISGELSPGDRVTVRPLVSLLGLSPTPIRTALALLERQGLLESLDHRGFFVPQFSAEDMREIYELREALEILACRRTVQSGSRLDIADDMAELIEQQRELVESGDLVGYADLDVRFHQQLWIGSGNKRLFGVSENLFGQMRIGNKISSQMPGRPETSLKEHEAIVAALRSGDGRAAERAVRSHVRTAAKAVAILMREDS